MIGVDVSPPVDWTRWRITERKCPAGKWRGTRMRPFGRKRETVPSMLQVLMRGLEFGGISFNHTHAAYADIYMRPPLLEFTGRILGGGENCGGGIRVREDEFAGVDGGECGGVTKARAATA